jgi:hypothetical protein
MSQTFKRMTYSSANVICVTFIQPPHLHAPAWLHRRLHSMCISPLCCESSSQGLQPGFQTSLTLYNAPHAHCGSSCPAAPTRA